MLLQLFDADDNGVMTLAELRTNSLTMSLLAPDVDLRDAGRDYEPGCEELDGTADALSVGAGFRAVRAAY